MALPVFSDLLDKEMNRKEFLIHVGMGVLAVVGITSLLHRLNSADHAAGSRSSGSSSYGGRKSNNLK